MPNKTSRIIVKKFRRAQALHKRGELNEARSIYLSILKTHPDHSDTLHYLGLMTYRSGNTDQAIQLIRQSLEKQADNVNAIKNLGNILLELDQPEQAEDLYRKVIELDKQDATVFNNLCVALRQQGRTEDAIQAGLTAAQLTPDYEMAWYSLGNAYKIGDKLKQAIKCYTRATELKPQLSPAHDALCQLTFRVEMQTFFGRRTLKKTLTAYQRWLECEPDSVLADFMLRAIRGEENLSRAPDDVVRNMFEKGAANFESHLKKLQYRVPELLKPLLNNALGEPQAGLSVLDGGCGTGLCADALKPFASELIGVDLSAAMMQLARRLNLYDELIESELTLYLQSKSAAFDLAVFADTLCYFGDLKEVIRATSVALRDQGTIIFSVELLSLNVDSRGYRLHPHGRYSHTLPYVKTTLLSYGFSDIRCHSKILRMEIGQEVAGLMVTATVNKVSE